MSKQLTYQQIHYRDGTSQVKRDLKALDPDYVSMDERSLADLLAFGRAYARELIYFNEQNEASGDWSGFLSPTLDLDEVAAFMKEPDKLEPEQREKYARPHLALFLVFLRLLRHAQAQMNTLTRRHLDFYFQEALRVTKKAAVPDKVRVLIEPASDVEAFELPAGALLDAGEDSLGNTLTYRTDRNIVVNKAKVEGLRSLFAQRRITGIREARELHKGTKEESFLAMFKIALGDPEPGDALPAPAGKLPPHGNATSVDYDYLEYLYALARFVPGTLYMDFSDFRSMMQRKLDQDNADAEWKEINALLAKAGTNRKSDFSWDGKGATEPAHPRDFDANLNTAMGKAPDFDGITLVEDIYDLYDQRARKEVQDFIRDDLHFASLDDFTRMMQIKTRIDSEWAEINRILAKAGGAKAKATKTVFPAAGKTFPAAGPKSPAFDANLTAALGTLDYTDFTGIDNLDQYHAALLQVEEYFFLFAEKFSTILATTKREETATDKPTTREWDKVYRYLAEAHEEKVYAGRREELKEVREREENGFDAMIRFALGEDASSASDPLARLKTFVENAADYAFLETIDAVADESTVSADDWARAYRIVEMAWRIREKLPQPVARKTEWLNLYPAADATKVTAPGAIADEDNPHWRTFGQAKAETESATPPAGVFGWAMGSPLLSLSQGQRTVTLTLGFDPEQFRENEIEALITPADANDANASDEGPFEIQVTTEKGWITPDKIKIALGDYYTLAGITKPQDGSNLKALKFTLTIAKNADAIAPLSADAATDLPIAGALPMVRLMLRQIWEEEENQYITRYQPLQDLVLLDARVKVSVDGLAEFSMENDDGTLDAKKPFEPFGPSPAVGSRFMLGHAELCKKLDTLKFDIEWMAPPADMADWYENYGDPSKGNSDEDSIDNASFKVDLGLVDQRVVIPLGEAALFSQSDAGKAHAIDLDNVAGAIETGQPGFNYESASCESGSASDEDSDDLQGWRYLQWELKSPDFQHRAYPVVASKEAMEMGNAMAVASKNGNGVTDTQIASYQVNPPYTPKIKTLGVSYSASVEVALDTYETGTQADRLFHIHPFGIHEARAPRGEDAEGFSFLPQYPNEGELYIGIAGAWPPQNLALLFQVAEGSANADLAPMPIQWSYLSGNDWVTLEDGNLLSDTTRGLINSGIVEFKLDPAKPNTLLPSDRYWLRAAIARNSDSVCDTVAIRAQAVSATFLDQGNAADHLARPLPAKTITGLVEALPEIGAIRQPYTSGGGKVREKDNLFYTRVSERLRHKQRALTLWDYERIILERFPEVYKVKCLPMDLARDPDNPGGVEIIVIPDIRDRVPFAPFEPKAPANLIADIRTYLADKVPTFAKVTVKNPHYIPVKARFGVRFREGYNEGYYKKQLNDDLNRFLSPWAYEEGADIVIGSRIYANVIIDFLERRPYVDYIAEVKLFSNEDGRGFKMAERSEDQGYWVGTERTDGVLVAARQHEIDIISEVGYEKTSFTGIDYMKVELDLVVATAPAAVAA
uniref:Baseplate J-like protein n=1 Tax=Candidatus Kentrum sp. UNK TaxID=2126344 RepID=A0A451AWR3_9GAMM|nr:MAG: Baseplate J-like protein [Candidatus Kentron sp. UNK]VFK70490.1 MAG: Baseplate J-like protein [Candidatus Kentron sp. UNK]